MEYKACYVVMNGVKEYGFTDGIKTYACSSTSPVLFVSFMGGYEGYVAYTDVKYEKGE